MNEQQMRSILTDLTEQNAPKATINLWPGIQSRIQVSDPNEPRGTQMNTRQQRIPRLAAAISLAAILAGVLFFTTPKGQALAQSMLRFFTRSESNQLPVQSWQLTPLPPPGTPTADPASIIDANQDIEEVQQKAGFDVYVPSWIPDTLHFSEASIDQDQKIVRIFYRYFETNGLVLRQEMLPRTNQCELCDTVGANAAVQAVTIGETNGEYVEGVWKLTENGPVWESDPYLKTLRWQNKDMAFELGYMGPPDTLSMEDMIAIAESMK